MTEYKIDEDGKKFKVRLGKEVGAVGRGGGWYVLGGLVRKIPWAQQPDARETQTCPPLSRAQIVRTFRIETRKASKAVARRKVRPCFPFLGAGGSPEG